MKYAIDKDVLIQKVSALKSDLDDKKNSRIKYLATEYRNGILKEIDKLCLVEEYKEIITFDTFVDIAYLTPAL